MSAESGAGYEELSVAVSPDEVDAGGAMTLTAELAPAPPDAEGREIVVHDEAGAEIARLPIVAVEDGAGHAEPVTVAAPDEAGSRTWTAGLAASGDDANGVISTSFTVTVVPHRVSVTVWDVPPTVTAGDHFSVKVGVKCSSACAAGGWPLEVRDADGTVVAATAVGAEVWPGSEAVRFTEIALAAGAEPGLQPLSAHVAPGGDGLPHAEASVTFRVRTVAAPEVRLTIAVREEGSGRPLAGARVVAHPFRAVTNAEGVAEFAMPRGEYRVFVSGARHLPMRRLVDMNEDTRLDVSLPFDAEPTEAELWT